MIVNESQTIRCAKNQTGVAKIGEKIGEKSVEEIAEDYRARREGLLRALTEGELDAAPLSPLFLTAAN